MNDSITGGDVMVASETGSGKTAAFGLPMIQCVHERLRQSLDFNKHPPGTSKSSGAVNKDDKKMKSVTASRDVVVSKDDKDALLSVDASGLECECTSQQQ